MTERLRQWHFQLLVRRGQQVEASCNGPDALAHFEQERARWLDDFLKSYEGKLDARLQSLIDQPSPVGTWLHDPSSAYSRNSVTLSHIIAAYERLRFNHQHDYAVYKLQKSTAKPFWQFVKWPARCQMAVLSGLVSACFVSALICSAILIGGHVYEILVKSHAVGLPANVERYVRTAAIVVAIIGAALHTIQEGLAPDKEIERYKDYRGRVSHLRDRFRLVTDARERLHLMEELEIASVEEMKGFLRTHHDARFVLA